MFESAELGHKIDKDTYDKEVPALREALLNAQFDLAEQAKFPVIILVGGVDGAGKGETINLLNEWMDPRHIRVSAMAQQSDEELQHPPMWRYIWALLPQGQDRCVLRLLGVYHRNHRARAGKCKGIPELDARIRCHLNHLREPCSAMKARSYIKLWFHLAKDVQKKRLKSLEKNSKNKMACDQAGLEQLHIFRSRSPSTPCSPTEQRKHGHRGSSLKARTARYRNPHHRHRLILGCLASASRRPARKTHPPFMPHPLKSCHRPSRPVRQTGHGNYAPATPKKFDRALEHYQGKLNLLTRDPRFERISVIAMFEGSDAAGKGGAKIRRITQRHLDAWHYPVSIRSPHPPKKNAPNPICGASGAKTASRSRDYLRPFLVWPRASGKGRKVLYRGGLDARLW